MDKLLAKLAVHGIMITSLLVLLSDASLVGALFTALGIWITAYAIGDLLILPSMGNKVATLADAGLVFLMLWLIGGAAGWTLSFTDMLMITVLAAIFEYFFHIWLLRDDGSVKKQRA